MAKLLKEAKFFFNGGYSNFTYVKQDSERIVLHRFWLKDFEPHFHYCRLDSSINA